jgi:hypothetical protein
MLSSSAPRRRCRINNFLTSVLAFSLVGLCTSEALVPSSTSSFLPRSLWGTRGGGGGGATSGSGINKSPSPLQCVLRVPPATSSSKSSSSSRDDTGGGDSQSHAAGGPGPRINGKKQTVLTTPPRRNGHSKETTTTTTTSTAAVDDLPIPAEYIAETKLPTDVGHFQLRAYRVQKGSNEHMGTEPCVIYSAGKSPFGTNGKLSENVPVRIHDQCLTSEVFRSQR